MGFTYCDELLRTEILSIHETRGLANPEVPFLICGVKWGDFFQFGPVVCLFVAVFIGDMPSVLAGCIIAFSLFTAIACVKNIQSFRRKSQQKG